MLHKKSVRTTLEGYALGAAYARRMRLMELTSLTTERSKTIFSELAQVRKLKSSAIVPASEDPGIKHLVSRRQCLDALGRRSNGS